MTLALVVCGVLAVALIVALIVLVAREHRYRALKTAHDEATLTRPDDWEEKGHRDSVSLAPFMPEMLERFAPGDWRSLGSPIDFVVFDGLHRGVVERIVLVDIQTQDASTEEQAAITAGIDAGIISLEYEILRMSSP